MDTGKEVRRRLDWRLAECGMTRIRCWYNFLPRELAASCGVERRGGLPPGVCTTNRSPRRSDHGGCMRSDSKLSLTRQVQKHLFAIKIGEKNHWSAERFAHGCVEQGESSPMPTGWRSTYLLVTWTIWRGRYQISAEKVTESGDRGQKTMAELVIIGSKGLHTSKEVPKMLSLTKDI